MVQVKLRRFYLHRYIDPNRSAGTGLVAEGVEFADGQCVMLWHTSPGSLCIYRNAEELIDIHGHGSNTVIRWVDGTN